jgi:hypothetical protein
LGDQQDAIVRPEGEGLMESQSLRYLLEEFPDFLTQYTPAERAFIERCQEERRKEEIPDEWRQW